MNKLKIYKLLRTLLLQDPNIKEEIKLKTNKYGNVGTDWTVATNGLSAKTKVYTFGIGNDLSFEEEIVKKFGVKVYAFDPTPRSVEWTKKRKFPPNIKIYYFGISDKDGFAYFEAPQKDNYVSFRISDKKKNLLKLPVYRLGTILKMLKQKRIDILKLDVEGTEYRIIPEILKSKLEIKQILVEFHHRFSGFTKKDTEKSVSNLRRFGFKLYFVSDSGTEYSFINSKYL